MNRQQTAVLMVAAINLALIGLFPPYDYIPPVIGGIGAFDGFSFVAADHSNLLLNVGFLQIELGVVALNAAIAWLIASRKPAPRKAGKRDWPTIVLAVTGINLALCLLFPPMQRTSKITRALLSSFDGFYFVFGAPVDHALVTQLLWLEVIFILVNGGLLYLLCKSSAPVVLDDAARARLAAELRKRG